MAQENSIVDGFIFSEYLGLWGKGSEV